MTKTLQRRLKYETVFDDPAYVLNLVDYLVRDGSWKEESASYGFCAGKPGLKFRSRPASKPWG
ncbi:MAG: hypothetical protein MK102_18415 [Fuerstiella sp.]|nr:hypothetical protein [Fuerstiella sp.]